MGGNSLSFFNKPVIKFNKIFQNAILPSKAHTGIFQDAAYDLFSSLLDELVIHPGERIMVPTGLRAILPEGYWVKFHERSGLASKGIHVMGGVIDSAYTGEWKVILYNSNTETVVIGIGKAIAQFTIEKLTPSTICEVNDVDFISHAANRERGVNGFGSSDEKKKN